MKYKIEGSGYFVKLYKLTQDQANIIKDDYSDPYEARNYCNENGIEEANHWEGINYSEADLDGENLDELCDEMMDSVLIDDIKKGIYLVHIQQDKGSFGQVELPEEGWKETIEVMCHSLPFAEETQIVSFFNIYKDDKIERTVKIDASYDTRNKHEYISIFKLYKDGEIEEKLL